MKMKSCMFKIKDFILIIMSKNQNSVKTENKEQTSFYFGKKNFD